MVSVGKYTLAKFALHFLINIQSQQNIKKSLKIFSITVLP